MPMTKRLIAAALLLCLAAGPALAAGAKSSPAGAWQTADGEARVRVSMCGDGTALCALLVGLDGAARTPENLRLLNTYVVEAAQRAAQNAWLGKVHFGGATAEGHITMVSANAITVSGCQLGMCKTLQFRRLSRGATEIADAASPPNLPQLAPRTVRLAYSGD